jgi:CubicO group peptidase (beta-lactamase class C family)
MVHHMSGLREKWDLFMLRGLPEGYLVTQNDVLEVLKKQRDLNFEPGTDQVYNNTAYDMLATIVQRASGKSIRDFAAERIFGPLGMQRSQYVDDWTLLVPGRAAGHSIQNGKVSLAAAHVETVEAGACTPPSRISPAGTRASTPDSWAGTRSSSWCRLPASSTTARSAR